MGYRSQVRFLIFGPEDKVSAFLTMQTLILGSKVFQDSDFINNLRRYPAERQVYSEEAQAMVEETIHVIDLYSDSWKWYENYEDAQAWNKLVEEAEEFGLDTEFLRIGEETNDIEHTSTSQSDWVLSINRTIDNEMNAGDDIPLGI